LGALSSEATGSVSGGLVEVLSASRAFSSCEVVFDTSDLGTATSSVSCVCCLCVPATAVATATCSASGVSFAVGALSSSATVCDFGASFADPAFWVALEVEVAIAATVAFAMEAVAFSAGMPECTGAAADGDSALSLSTHVAASKSATTGTPRPPTRPATQHFDLWPTTSTLCALSPAPAPASSSS